jgi:hypothetical protein
MFQVYLPWLTLVGPDAFFAAAGSIGSIVFNQHFARVDTTKFSRQSKKALPPKPNWQLSARLPDIVEPLQMTGDSADMGMHAAGGFLEQANRASPRVAALGMRIDGRSRPLGSGRVRCPEFQLEPPVRE